VSTPKITLRAGPEQTGTSTANCQAGEAALGGGGVSIDGLLWNSSPSTTGGTPTDWEASAVETDGVTDATAQAYVVCAGP